MSPHLDFARAYVGALTEVGICRFEDLRLHSPESLVARLDQIVSTEAPFTSQRNRRVVQRLFEQADTG